MNFYDYYSFIQDVIKAKTHLSDDYYQARWALTRLHFLLNNEMAEQI
jgi:hypothetical protein